MELFTSIVRSWRHQAAEYRCSGEVAAAEALESCAAQISTRITSVDAIKRDSCRAFGVTIDQLESPCRIKAVVEARNAAMKRCREEIPMATLEEIGRHFNRSHATVLHGIRKAKKMMEGC